MDGDVCRYGVLYVEVWLCMLMYGDVLCCIVMHDDVGWCMIMCGVVW